MDYRLRHVTQAIYCNGLIVRLLGFKCWRPMAMCPGKGQVQALTMITDCTLYEVSGSDYEGIYVCCDKRHGVLYVRFYVVCVCFT